MRSAIVVEEIGGAPRSAKEADKIVDQNPRVTVASLEPQIYADGSITFPGCRWNACRSKY